MNKSNFFWWYHTLYRIRTGFGYFCLRWLIYFISIFWNFRWKKSCFIAKSLFNEITIVSAAKWCALLSSTASLRLNSSVGWFESTCELRAQRCSMPARQTHYLLCDQHTHIVYLTLHSKEQQMYSKRLTHTFGPSTRTRTHGLDTECCESANLCICSRQNMIYAMLLAQSNYYHMIWCVSRAHQMESNTNVDELKNRAGNFGNFITFHLKHSFLS